MQAVLKKAGALEIAMICPLHGFVWRENISYFIDKYLLWSSYQPEEKGVVIAYASVYGHTANAMEILSCALREKGVKVRVFDVSVTPASDVISAVFKYSHLVAASTTYNAGVFVKMEEFLNDLAAHNIQNRTVAIVENGSWAPASAKLMRQTIEGCKKMTILDETLTLKSSLKEEQMEQIGQLAEAIAASVKA